MLDLLFHDHEAAGFGFLTGAILGVAFGWIGMTIIRRKTSDKRLGATFNGVLLLMGIVALVVLAIPVSLQTFRPDPNGSTSFFLTSFVFPFASGSFFVIFLLLAIEAIGRMRGTL